MNKGMDKFLKDLSRAMEKSGVENMSKKDQTKFFESVMSDGLIPINSTSLTESEEALDLVYKALEATSRARFRKYIEEALSLDPFCEMAFEALGDNEPDSLISIAYYKTAMDFGLNKYLNGPKEKRVPIGMFYGVFETRSTMRSMYQYAECLLAIDEQKMAADIYKEIIRLNESDNQGARFILLYLLIALEDKTGFKKYQNQFSDDASCDINYAIALYIYKYHKDDVSKLEEAKKQALKSNKHVPGIFRKKEVVEFSQPFYQMGGEDEAVMYLDRYEEFWDEVEGARDWLESW
jgi:hypothetical protein